MIEAVYGLVGVALGFLLTFVKDWWMQKSKQQKEISYLCIHVSCELDRFVDGCSSVVGDDGLYQGQPDKHGCHFIQVERPTFEPKSLDVDWKSVPAKILYEILNFPIAIESSNKLIDGAFENTFPPEYYEGYEERQLQYAVLGIKADDLASRLRKLGKLPPKEISEYDPVKYMNERKSKIEELRDKRYRRQQEMNNSVSSVVAN
jgi:hypothetical protein